MCLCACVCGMCICTCVSVCAVRVYVCMYVCVSVCSVCMCVHVCSTCICTSGCAVGAYVCVCVCVYAKSLQSCPALCNPIDCSMPGSSVHGILQARILQLVAISFSRIDLPGLGIKLVSLALAGRFFTTDPPGKPQSTAFELGFFFFFPAAPRGMRDLSFLTRD